MTATREAITLPLLLLSVVLLGGLHLGDVVRIGAPSLFALVLATLVMGALVQSGTVAPALLMDQGRTALANLNGLTVLLATFAATAQVVTLVTPASGAPAVFFSLFFLVMLLQVLAVSPDRTRLLRALLVTLGAAFTLKFVVLAALSAPASGPAARALQLLFEGVTLGAVSQANVSPVAGYVAFVTIGLYLTALLLLPAAGWVNVRTDALTVGGRTDGHRRQVDASNQQPS